MRFTQSVLTLTALALAAATSATACSSAPSAPAPTASSGASTPGSLPADGAPKVQHPLDVSKFQQNPCAMLTATQLQQLGVAVQGKPGNIGLGPLCDWTDSSGPSGLGFGATLVAGGYGLSGAYANRSGLQLFQPIPDIEGYPALLADQADLRNQGQCGVDVGTSDQVAVDIGVVIRGGAHPGPNYNNPCAVAEIIAKQIMITMKRGGGA